MELITSGGSERSNTGGIQEKIGQPSVRSALTWIPSLSQVLARLFYDYVISSTFWAITSARRSPTSSQVMSNLLTYNLPPKATIFYSYRLLIPSYGKSPTSDTLLEMFQLKPCKLAKPCFNTSFVVGLF